MSMMLLDGATRGQGSCGLNIITMCMEPLRLRLPWNLCKIWKNMQAYNVQERPYQDSRYAHHLVPGFHPTP